MLANGTALPFQCSTNVNPGPGNLFVCWVLERKITDQLALGVELFHKTGGVRRGFNVGGISK
jgi:hypothetical protein